MGHTETSAIQTQPVFDTILNEIRLLRRDVLFIMTKVYQEENVEDFTHPARIQKSYERALKKYPPRYGNYSHTRLSKGVQ